MSESEPRHINPVDLSVDPSVPVPSEPSVSLQSGFSDQPSVVQEVFNVPLDERGRRMWSFLNDKPEEVRKKIIEDEATRLLTGGVALDDRKIPGIHGFMAAVSTYYPGGRRELRSNLGLPVKNRPLGYWTPELIEQEAQEFYLQHGELTQRLLNANGKRDLVNGIKQYPGGARKLKEKLGIESDSRPEGYWTPERIE